MSELSAILKQMGFSKTFPVQEKAFSQFNDSRHITIQAPTGSGKTLSYLIPLCLKLKATPEERALIITPSPELAMQIQKVTQEIPEDIRIDSTCFVGSGNIKRQRDKLKKCESQIIVGTPGRLLEFFDRKLLKAPKFDNLILDEADYILTDEIRDDFFQHFKYFPEHTKLITASATQGPESQAFIDTFMIEPVEISGFAISETVAHSYLLFPENKKDVQLARYLQKNKQDQVLIFCNMQKHVSHLERFLVAQKVNCDSLHGQSDKKHRQKCLERFHKGTLKVLIATDTLSRGIDFDNPTIVQYDIAGKPSNFIHRSGRTGRAGKRGKHLILVSDKEGYRIGKLEKKLGVKFEEYTELSKSKKPFVQKPYRKK